MADWQNPTEATWIAGIATVATAIIAVAIAIAQGYFSARAARKAREARAWQQALLIEPVVLHVSSKLAVLPEAILDASSAGKILDRAGVDFLQVKDIDELAESIDNVDALEDPLRTNILRLVAWGRSLNKNIAAKVQHPAPGFDGYALSPSVNSDAFRNHLAELQSIAKRCASDLRDFINKKGEDRGAKSFIAEASNRSVPVARTEAANTWMRKFLRVEPQEFKPKWVFDHFQNYGIAAGVAIAGAYAFRHGPVMSSWPYVEPVLSVLLMIAGFLLFVLNALQGIWAMADKKARWLPYIFVSLLIFFGGSELFWSIFTSTPH